MMIERIEYRQRLGESEFSWTFESETSLSPDERDRLLTKLDEITRRLPKTLDSTGNSKHCEELERAFSTMEPMRVGVR